MIDYRQWYTDLVSIYRVQDVQDGALTRKERVLIHENLRGRVYQTQLKSIQPKQTAAEGSNEFKLSMDVNTDIIEGDELLIERGGALRPTGNKIRAFAGLPNYFYEPFGAVMPGIEHLEVALMRQERVTGT